jgi:mitochondrial import inner membrane translocase subunit TIM16
MSLSEAKMILSVQKLNAAEINSQFDRLYKLNDPAKGGSFYLQCKLMGAKETLLKSL